MFLGITACLLALASCSGTLPAQSPPNVLFITADDLGLQLGCYGDTVIETPQLDAFAASGVQFDVAYVAQASCSPSRSAMFTGLYVHSTGQYGLTNGTPFALHRHLEDATIPNILKRAGYRTGIIGKLHVAPGASFQFDYRQTSYVDARQVKLVAERASEFITQSGDQPFFLMVNYTDPHAYRGRDPQTNQFGDWTFLDRVDGIPKPLSSRAKKASCRFNRSTRPSSANASPATTTRSSDSTSAWACCSKRSSVMGAPTTPWSSSSATTGPVQPR